MSHALITSDVLSWAIERSRLPISSVAKRIKISADKLISWEKGQQLPSFNQAKKLANILSIPFGYLYLSSPPKEKILIPDLRTIYDERYVKFSPNFHDLLDDILRKQEWYKDYLLANEEKSVAVIGKYQISDNVMAVADNMRSILGIDAKVSSEARSWSDFLRKIITNAEERGLIILRSGIVGSNTRRKLSVDEFRGFAIYDNYAPIIFINSTDAKTAQIFTLAHELAHLWLGKSGISNINLRKLPREQNGEIEIFCDKVAAEFLVPENDFLLNWRQNLSIDKNLSMLVRQFRVSSIVILRRAYDLNKITKTSFFEHYNQELNNYIEFGKKSKGGNFHNSFWARNSNSIAGAIITSTMEGKTLYRDAARLLNVKVGTINKLATTMGIR